MDGAKYIKYFNLIKQNTLFYELNNAQLSLLLSLASIKQIEKEDYLIKEGELDCDLYLIIEGKVAILKKDENGVELPIAYLGMGESIGEMNVIEKSNRSASVKAISSVEVLVLPIEKLAALAEHKATYAQIVSNISKKLNARIRHASEYSLYLVKKDLENEKLKNEMGEVIFKMLILLSLWVFLAILLQPFVKSAMTTSLVTFPVILGATLVCLYHVKHSLYPPKFYGLTFLNWKNNLIESFILTLPILLLATILKWTFLPSLETKPQGGSFIFLIPFLYVLFTPLQEFMFRGTLQSAIKVSLSGKYPGFWSIMIANLVFAAGHSHLSMTYAIAAFISGLLWGWLYERQGSLVGPIFSHALVGWWALSILDLQSFLAI